MVENIIPYIGGEEEKSPKKNHFVYSEHVEDGED